MNWTLLCQLIVLYFVFSVLGWMMEVTLKYIQYHRFINRGFLIGPYCPIYGSGVVLVTVLVGGLVGIRGGTPGEIFLAGFFICGGLEYFISWYMEKAFHARWWDYSQKPGNIEGIICPEFSLYWTLLGAFYCYVIHPVFHYIVGWFFNNIVLSFFLGAFFGVFVIDLFYSFRILAKIRKFAADNHITVRLQALQKNIAGLYERRRFRHMFTLRENLLAPEILRESMFQLKKKLPKKKKDGEKGGR